MIEHGYLMWVGESHHETAKSFVEEVRSRGVSKRLPGYGVGLALQKPGTLVYVAHDDGEAYSCESCFGQVECSACRTKEHAILKWQAEADAVTRRYPKGDIPRGKERIREIRAERIQKARAAMAACELCHGKGTYECGTGGYIVRMDGTKMDYRTYNFWMRQPHKFDVAKEVRNFHMCEDCGGTGKRPAAEVFGCFVPTVEYIRNGEETKEERKQYEVFDQLTEAQAEQEPERVGGRRTPGFYAVARAGKGSRRGQAVARELQESRAVKGDVEVIGDFVLFTKPVKVETKRFRGIKHFQLGKSGGNKAA